MRQTKEPAPAGVPSPGKQYHRPREEARRLGISRRQLSNWMKAGIVPYLKLGRLVLFDPIAVDAALTRFESQEVGRPE